MSSGEDGKQVGTLATLNWWGLPMQSDAVDNSQLEDADGKLRPRK